MPPEDEETAAAIRRSAVSTNEDDFHFYEDLDSFVGTPPTSSPRATEHFSDSS